jgi:hypothetical protein
LLQSSIRDAFARRRLTKEDVMHQSKSIAASVLFALATLVSAGGLAAGPVTSSLMVPVDGLVFQPGGTFESIALTGRMHLVTQFYPTDPCIPNDPCRVFFDLADVKGIGLPSGNSYVAIGAVTTTCMPVDPCFPSFTILPVSVPNGPPIAPPSPIMPITFSVRIAFDSAGHLSTDGIVVQLPGCNTDICH